MTSHLMTVLCGCALPGDVGFGACSHSVRATEIDYVHSNTSTNPSFDYPVAQVYKSTPKPS